jgi:hypothetical protein
MNSDNGTLHLTILAGGGVSSETGPYPSFCGQSGSPHNWTDMLSKSHHSSRTKQIQLPQRAVLFGILEMARDIHCTVSCLFSLTRTQTQTRGTPSALRILYPALHPASPSYSCENERQVAVTARRPSIVIKQSRCMSLWLGLYCSLQLCR